MHSVTGVSGVGFKSTVSSSTNSFSSSEDANLSKCSSFIYSCFTSSFFFSYRFVI